MKIHDKALLQISSSDAEKLGVKEGETVRLRSPQGEVEVGVEIQPALPAGLVFFPEHFNTPSVKDLLPVEVDPVTGVIYHKMGPVAIDPITVGSGAVK